MAKIIEVVFDTYDNISLVLFKEDDIAVDFSAATRFVLFVGGITIDTDSDVNTITTTAVQGELQFDLGGKSLLVGEHSATLIVYDPSHTNGQIFACADDSDLIFQVKLCS